jgi:hypothetical protein
MSLVSFGRHQWEVASSRFLQGENVRLITKIHSRALERSEEKISNKKMNSVKSGY